MKSFNHWMVALDLTNMDDIIIGYLNFLAEIHTPQKVTFIHIVEESGITANIKELFPEIEDSVSLDEVIKDELQKKVKAKFNEGSTEIEFIVEEGASTEIILSALSEFDPDLLALGKKSGYEGEGILARKISKYTHCSILFISENSKYRLENIHVPITFNQSSAWALKRGKSLAAEIGAILHVQHVYDYPKQFFPYIPSDQYSERMNEHLEKKYQKFKDKFNLKEVPECIFTVNSDGKEADQIYDLTLQTRADLILVGSKSKSSAAALLTEELADDLAEYHFGIPVLIYKEKEEHVGLLRSLLESK